MDDINLQPIFIADLTVNANSTTVLGSISRLLQDSGFFGASDEEKNMRNWVVHEKKVKSNIRSSHKKKTYFFALNTVARVPISKKKFSVRNQIGGLVS
jgi:hypothetical protein